MNTFVSFEVSQENVVSRAEDAVTHLTAVET